MTSGGTGGADSRDRLAELESALARLRAEYEVLMNRFKFEAAGRLVPAIEAAERERQLLAARVPLPPVAPPTPFVVNRRRRRRL